MIGAKYLKMEKSVCFLESSVYVVEVPVREHGKAEVIEAKEKEIENLKLYETFEKIDDEGHVDHSRVVAQHEETEHFKPANTKQSRSQTNSGHVKSSRMTERKNS